MMRSIITLMRSDDLPLNEMRGHYLIQGGTLMMRCIITFMRSDDLPLNEMRGHYLM